MVCVPQERPILNWGIGLGLYISKYIIESHGGMKKGENNKDGKGATFTFVLPLEQGEQHKDQ